MTVTFQIEVCDDCAMLIANGETPEDNPEFRLSDSWDGYHIALDCPEDGCESFSWSSCDGCESSLGGNRHPAVAMSMGGKT